MTEFMRRDNEQHESGIAYNQDRQKFEPSLQEGSMETHAQGLRILSILFTRDRGPVQAVLGHLVERSGEPAVAIFPISELQSKHTAPHQARGKGELRTGPLPQDPLWLCTPCILYLTYL